MNETIIISLLQEIGPVLISAIIAWLAWLFRRYVNSISDEKKLATIVRVSNAAIDYAEDLDKRGELGTILARLDLPNGVIQHTSKGIQKLHIAGKWVEDELKRMGINMTDEEARKWVAAEFQGRIAGLNLTSEQLGQIQDILNLLQKLDQNKLKALLTDNSQQVPRPDELIPQSVLIPVETKPALEPTVFTSTPSSIVVVPESGLSPENHLAEIAQQAVKYVETLKIDRQLTVPDIDIATAWVLTEVTKQGISVTPDQIAREVHKAMI